MWFKWLRLLLGGLLRMLMSIALLIWGVYKVHKGEYDFGFVFIALSTILTDTGALGMNLGTEFLKREEKEKEVKSKKKEEEPTSRPKSFPWGF
jgi:hypothetical protein